MKRRTMVVAFGIACATALAPRAASAFCGFYVAGGGARLYNHATQVVLMREGLRTVLAMANDYEGPPEGFALVVPVPVVLQKGNVKTLSRELLERIDQLDAPRLVEYWEQDPCRKDEGYGYEFSDDPLASGGFGPNDATIRVRTGAPTVKVLNRFSAGEYDIVILGAQDSLGLETWLHEHGYKIPAGAEPALRPYVLAGMKFFVARVDPAKVRFDHGRASLSPLRFHYDAEAFSLPIRLGLLNSAGVQDLIVHLLARGQRYETANYDSVVIPTNLDVKDAAKPQFGAFYAALFDHTLAARPRAVVTEYAWQAGSCDPCPIPPLEPDDLAALGAEVLPSAGSRPNPGEFVLTRLHARYNKGSLGADLIFREAMPISGGREERGPTGALEQGAVPSGQNNFQARYTIRHPWPGSVSCTEPRRNIWGGPPGGEWVAPIPALNLASAPRASVDLASFLGQAAPDPGVLHGRYALPALPAQAPAAPHSGCAGCRVGSEERAENSEEGTSVALLGILAATAMLRRQRRARDATPPRAGSPAGGTPT